MNSAHEHVLNTCILLYSLFSNVIAAGVGVMLTATPEKEWWRHTAALHPLC